MDLRQLTYVLTVAEQRSMTKAALVLYISQPSLSSIIAKTEKEMGHQIFDRSTHPISLTYAGERFVDAARQILFQFETLKKEFLDISQNKKGRLTIGIPPERAAYMLPLVLPQYHKQYAGIEVNTIVAKSSGLEDLVIKGKADFIILPSHVKMDSLKFETIYEEELVLVTAQGIITPELLLDDTTVNLKSIQHLPFILLKEGHGIRSALDILFHHFNMTPNIILETHSNEIAYRLATAGMGVAIVPKMTIHLAKSIHPPFVYSLSKPPITWDIVAAYRKDGYISHAEWEFFAIAKKAMEDQLSTFFL